MPPINARKAFASFLSRIATFDSDGKGAVPASGGGTRNFLRADGTWANPGGGMSSNWGAITGGGNETMNGSSSVQGLSPSGGEYTALKDLYFDNLTVNAGVTLRLNGYRLYVAGTLTVNGRVCGDGYVGGIGNIFSGGGGGLGGGGSTGALGFGSNGGQGKHGGGGSNGDSLSNILPAPFGVSDGTGNGGAAFTVGGVGPALHRGGGGGGGGGVVGTPDGGLSGGSTTVISSVGNGPSMFNMTLGFLGASTNLRFNGGSGGGGGGAVGGGAASGGGGGGGGGVAFVWAGTIAGAGFISANGGEGAPGWGSSGNGFGGGGGGGGGGVLTVIYNTRSGVTVQAIGGAGGASGGADSGAGGAGAAGRVFLFNTSGNGT